MADEGFHEIHLSGKHLVALFMAATVVAVVVFLCGVAVGRGVLEKRTAQAEASPPADPTADSQSPSGADPTTGSSVPEPSASSQETLSYPDRLASANPPSETLKPTGSTSRPAPVEPAPPAPALPAARSAEATTAPSAPPEPSGPGFAVQVAAVRERGEADTIAKRLSTRGYRAYVMAPVNGAPKVFRVRVGKFKERREAEQIAGKLQKEEQFKPWITR
jgi:cell division septation protein DedD